MSGPLTLARTEALRRTPGATALLYLTDRCPVGCEHCSVSARPDGPTVSDPALLEELLEGLCGRGELLAVAISGGEPFTERRGLTRAVERLADADKAVVLFTSGNWAGPGPARPWIAGLLPRVATVFLGVDTHHTDRLGPARLRSAIGAVTAAGCHLVLQVIDTPGQLERAREALRGELGDSWRTVAELHPTAPLALGRGARLFAPPAARPAAEFGPCLPASAPTVRYDGTVSGCCNEAVITGDGPASLRRTVDGRKSLATALDGFRRSPLLRVMAGQGPGSLARLPGFEELADGRFRSVCDACWAAHDIVARGGRPAALLGLLAPGDEEVQR